MKKFVQQIVEQDTVYTLASNSDFSFVGSNLFSNPDGSPVPVWCFWSDKSSADSNKKEDWENYILDSFPLANFIEDVLVPMTNEGHIVGINFDESLTGVEADPLDTLLEMISEIKKRKINVELEYFKNIEDLEKQARKLMQ